MRERVVDGTCANVAVFRHTCIDCLVEASVNFDHSDEASVCMLTGCTGELCEAVLVTVPSRSLVLSHAIGERTVADGGPSCHGPRIVDLWRYVCCGRVEWCPGTSGPLLELEVCYDLYCLNDCFLCCCVGDDWFCWSCCEVGD